MEDTEAWEQYLEKLATITWNFPCYRCGRDGCYGGCLK